MSSYVKKIISVISCIVLAALFIVVMHFTAPEIRQVPETQGKVTYYCHTLLPDGSYESERMTAVVGEDVTAVRISDLENLNKITAVNYVPNEYVYPNSLTSDVQIVDLTKPFEFAERGTLIFIVMNLDEESEDFAEQADKLSEYKIGENWEFTLSIPKIFSASNIYLDSDLKTRTGEIKGYNFIDFTTSYDKVTEKYTEKVVRTSLDLKFYTKRHALNPCHMITVHYQSTGTIYSGIADCPLIGKDTAVENTLKNSQNLLIMVAVLAAVTIVVLVVLSVLKHTNNFMNSILWVFGIVLMLFPRFLLGQATSVPLLLSGLFWSAAFLSLCGALLALGRNIGKVPVKYIFPPLMLVGGLLAFLTPFLPFGAAMVLRTIASIIKVIGTAALLGFIGFATFYKEDNHTILEIITVSIIAVATLASVFVTPTFPAYCSPFFWLCTIAVIVTFIGVFIVFYNTEKDNAYLTANLHLEMDRQLKDIKAVITERDNLLQFVSHDMKKPLQSAMALIDTLIEREKDVEQTKGLNIVKRHTSRVIENLSEIGSYARFNYIAEPSQVTDLFNLCVSICDFHAPDCIANGIILKNFVDKHYKVFIKKQGLENAVSNIILNAIEHANCQNITLSAKREKNRIILCIADDGKGINSELDIFKVYVSEKSETNGVGLFICKNILESMNGEISYQSVEGNTVFYLSLLKA